MSRGYGKIQRAVLAYFAENPDAKTSIAEITCVSLEKDSISVSEYMSFRRAMSSLLAEGRLRKWPCRVYGGYYWFMTPEKYEAYVESTKHLFDLMGDKRI